MTGEITINAVDLEALIAILTFIFSVGMSAVIGGMRWQRLQDKVENMQEDLKEIKGMFSMTMKKDQ